MEVLADPCKDAEISILEGVIEWSPEQRRSNITYTLGQEVLTATLDTAYVSMDNPDAVCPDYIFEIRNQDMSFID